MCNSTTLGPYSFQIFVALAWTAKKVANGQSISAGRRTVTVVGTARRKRPLAAEIAKTAQKSSKKSLRNMLHVDEEKLCARTAQHTSAEEWASNQFIDRC